MRFTYLRSGVSTPGRPALAFSLVPKSATTQGDAKTKLTKWRIERGLSQPQMVQFTGIPISSYQRLEEGNYVRFPYQQLRNCATVLGVELDELIEDRFKGWTVFSEFAKEPPTTPVWSADS